MIRTKPTGANLLTLTELEAFAAKISRDDNGCWNWTGSITTTGYGEYWNRARGFVHVLVHRLVLELIHKDIRGLIPDHQCENTRCCNPAHMTLGTQADNVLRGNSPQAKNRLKTHCPKGHEYTPENTYIRPSKNWRECRACWRSLEATDAISE